MFGIKRLRRENALLREALDWYATGANWRKRGTNPKGEPRKWIKSPAAFDRGARAKFVLTQIAAMAPKDGMPCPTAPPISSTASSTTSPRADVKSGWTAGSADTPDETP